MIGKNAFLLLLIKIEIKIITKKIANPLEKLLK